MPRAFKISGGTVGLFYVVAAPVIMALVALLGSDRFALIGGAVAMVLGPVVYGTALPFRHKWENGRPERTER